uniref:Uncharacterized protein n=1 Tax=Anguilla anguilla TaxID=7936 RepID=A0A0E9T980_ANGAN
MRIVRMYLWCLSHAVEVEDGFAECTFIQQYQV